MSKHKAYTLIELLLVLSLLSLIGAAILLRSGSLDHYKERQDVRSLALQIKQARNMAIAENISTTINLGPDNQATISRESNPETTLFYQHLNSISGKRNSPQPMSIIFSRIGAPSPACTLYLVGKSGRIHEISVEVATGKVNIKSER